MHILATLKFLAPLSLYLVGIFCAMLAFGGQIQWAILLIVFLSPLRNVVEKLQELPSGGQFLDILFAGSVFGWFISSMFTRSKFFERSSVNFISILLIMYTIISVLVGSHYLFGSLDVDLGDPRVQDAKNFCMLPVLFFLVLNGIKEKKWVWRTFVVMCASMVLMNYYTVSQTFEFSSLISRAKMHGTFQFLGPNEVAAFYNMNIVVMLGIYFYMKKGWQRLALLGLIIVNMYSMIFMFSRAAYAATVVGFMILFAMKRKRLLIPLFLIAIFWQAVLPQKVIERIEETKNSYGELDESSARRLEIWAASMLIFQNNLLAGTGYGTFRHMGFNLGDTHNIYFKIAVEQGVLGLAIFALLIICFLKEGYTLYKKGEDEESRGLGLGFTAMVIVLLVNCFFGDRWSYYELCAYCWVYAGLVARMNAISATQSATQRISSQKKSKNRKSSKYNA